MATEKKAQTVSERLKEIEDGNRAVAPAMPTKTNKEMVNVLKQRANEWREVDSALQEYPTGAILRDRKFKEEE